MALINCPECGKEVSDLEEVCIHCGYPLKSNSNNSSSYAMIDGKKVDLSEVYHYVAKGDKIRAIQKYRELTETGLKEAKDFVENISVNRNLDHYEREPEMITVRCPDCGSTQIKEAPRRWSILGGLGKNKMDRVCMYCNCKF